jgi:hypothetical protein
VPSVKSVVENGQPSPGNDECQLQASSQSAANTAGGT